MILNQCVVRIPSSSSEKLGDETDDWLRIFVSVNGGPYTIEIKIVKDITRPYNYNTSIKFKNGTRTIYGTHIDNFKDGGMNVFSAYRITKEFINEKIINKYRSIIDIEEFSKDQAEEELRGIMGIFALKLMGDFSQELYSLCLSNRTLGAEVLPILFVANDRVSAARYILLKQFGMRVRKWSINK